MRPYATLTGPLNLQLSLHEVYKGFLYSFAGICDLLQSWILVTPAAESLGHAYETEDQQPGQGKYSGGESVRTDAP